MRSGIGFDFHPFKRGEVIYLGGVEIPCEYTLEGHSDADVIIHAIVDSLLGAAALGDIGEYFPPSDERWKNVRSEFFLRETIELLRKKGYRVVNVDLTYIGEVPRLSRWKKSIEQNLERIISAPVNVKATTMEGMGVIGQKEGAAAIAISTIEEVKNG